MSTLALLTDRLFDYAGMFPPAALPFEEALRKSAGFPDTLRRPEIRNADMVLTPDTLPRLTPEAMEAAGWAPDRPCTVCLVGVPAADLGAQADAALSWNQARTDGPFAARIVSVETTVGDDLRDPAPVRDALAAAQASLGDITLCVEPRWPDAAWAQGQDRVLALLDDLPGAGLKVRCAGPTALSHATLGKLLPEVVRRGLRLKATQGLHHPFAGDERHGNGHGFLNLAVGLRMARVLGADTLTELLADPEPASFVFGDGLRWREHCLLAQRVHDEVRRVPFQIGSCSLDEPDADLAAIL